MPIWPNKCTCNPYIMERKEYSIWSDNIVICRLYFMCYLFEWIYDCECVIGVHCLNSSLCRHIDC
jgi:hypothetical protein